MSVEYAEPEGSQRATATTLGAGGMFIATERPLRPATLLKLRFRISPEGQLHEIEGRVAWANRPETAPAGTTGMGIEFTDPAACSKLARELEGLPPLLGPDPGRRRPRRG